jgi:hypothetical protein
VELTVVGCGPAKRFRHLNLRVIAFLNKNKVAERTESAHFHIMSHLLCWLQDEECYGFVRCEANA